MKTIKTIFKTITFLSLIFFMGSCSQTDPPESGGVAQHKKFSISGTDYQTDYAYIFVDGGTPLTDGFMLVLTDAKLQNHSVHGVSMETIMNQGISLLVKFSNGNQPTQQDVLNQLANTTHNLSDECMALTDIVDWHDTYLDNTIQFGLPNETTANTYEKDDAIAGDLTITNFWNSTIAGAINCTYTFTDSNNVVVSGTYNGPFEIITEL
ncbi:MAG: hypothetical protein V3U80_10470 [Flavobacteriaceae bacterium]